MKIAITDYSFPSLDIEEGILRPLGHDIVAWKEKRTAAELPQLVADADAVITQFAPVTADVIASMRQAKVIVRYGIGVDNVDLEAAKGRGIPVCNVPDYCIDEVADQTLAFLLATTRQVVTNCVRNREGKWGLATPLDQMRALRDLTVGVVGFGRIGREVVARLRAFKCKVLVHDPVVAVGEIEQAGCKPVMLRELLSQSDVISLHCPSMAQTRGMINRDSLAITKRGVILINVARGDLVDSAALIEALQSGHVSAAALDVFAPEPIPADHPILKMDNVIVASHIASCSVPAVRKLRETAANLAAMALRGESLPNVVNGVGK
ncbi:MAG: C-terminal binding protein [Candidatus Saccharimonas sp.]|nr:C-terminal binding protein [Planctomycetaceae bacterium]